MIAPLVSKLLKLISLAGWKIIILLVHTAMSPVVMVVLVTASTYTGVWNWSNTFLPRSSFVFSFSFSWQLLPTTLICRVPCTFPGILKALNKHPLNETKWSFFTAAHLLTSLHCPTFSSFPSLYRFQQPCQPWWKDAGSFCQILATCFIFKFCGSIVDLQCCVNFRGTA